MINSSNALTGSLLKQASEVRDFVDLKAVNDSLLKQNSRLLAMLDSADLAQQADRLDSLRKMEIPQTVDSVNQLRYEYIGAMVRNNTTNQVNNFITIDKGSKQGIQPEMGVISAQGIVGVVTNVSDNFASIISLLNKNLKVSAKIQQNSFIGSLRWDVLDPQSAILEDIPKHAPVYIGDTVATSGFSAFFPGEIPIGVIEDWKLPEGGNFYNITVKLSTDFNRLNYVYVIKNKQQKEQKELEAQNK